jgi:hypothetical protein
MKLIFTVNLGQAFPKFQDLDKFMKAKRQIFFFDK